MSRLLRSTAAALVAAACLVVLQPRVYSQGHELDEYTDEELMEDLTDEVDDILDVFDDDEQLVPVATLRTLLSDAFSDDGDDADEQDISYADLVEEVAEVGRTMPQEINLILGQPLNASQRLSPAWTVAQVNSLEHPLLSGSSNLLLLVPPARRMSPLPARGSVAQVSRLSPRAAAMKGVSTLYTDSRAVRRK